jgi:hypothetical protein
MSAFAAAAVNLTGAGLAVLPLGGDDGKVPLVRGWSRWHRRPGRAFIEHLIERHPGANIGISCGPSHVFLVDNDDPKVVRPMVERFGDTPLKTGTPSGGVHLWYRGSGERCGNLRSEGLPVDLKGMGGLVVVPPSVRPSGPYAGRAYEFIEGSWDDLDRLPVVRPGSLSGPRPVNDGPTSVRAIKKGYRNNTLFRALLKHARFCDDFRTLFDVAETINTDAFEPPLPAAEVAKTVASVWAYQVSGRNRVAKEPSVEITLSEWERLAAHENGADGMLLLPKLRFVHWDNERFAASPKAMYEAQVIPGWGHNRYRKGLAALTDTEILSVLHPGGRGAGDPRLFSFSRAFYEKGTSSVPNITNTPLAPASHPLLDGVQNG